METRDLFLALGNALVPGFLIGYFFARRPVPARGRGERLEFFLLFAAVCLAGVMLAAARAFPYGGVASFLPWRLVRASLAFFLILEPVWLLARLRRLPAAVPWIGFGVALLAGAAYLVGDILVGNTAVFLDGYLLGLAGTTLEQPFLIGQAALLAFGVFYYPLRLRHLAETRSFHWACFSLLQALQAAGLLALAFRLETGLPLLELLVLSAAIAWLVALDTVRKAGDTASGGLPASDGGSVQT